MSQISPFIGIDFGTSNSKMAWYNPKTNQVEILRNAEGEEQTPSVVYFSESETLVGSPAEAMLEYEQERERIIMSIKRELVTTPVIALPGRVVKPVEVAAEILHKLKRDAEEQHFLQEITRAVITCPASFGPLEWDKIREAAQLAGFGEVERLEEPVAAALAYAQMGFKVGKYVLVYDLGGGTFDLAVLARENDGLFHPALEPQGIKRCGGDDFDEALYNFCDGMAREKLGRPISLTGKRDLHFLSECRQRKENLSFSERRMFKSLLEPGAVLFQHEIDRVTFESLISPTVEETVCKTVALLEQANAEGYGVDTVVLVGGSTRVPLTQRLLNTSLPLQAIPWQHRDVAVAFGAAYHAYSLWRPENQYRKAVALAWTDKKLDEIKIAQLTALANDLGLTEDQAADLERKVMEETKEEIFAHQRALEQYHLAVEAVWAERRLDEAKAEQLKALANKLGLKEDQTADIEREVMRETKGTILARREAIAMLLNILLAHQRAFENYREAVEAAWTDKKLDKREIEKLEALVNVHGLSRSVVAGIEREVMGETKEAIFARQVALEQYREAVGEAWIDRKLNETKIEQLNALANKLDLSEDQVAAVEREVMGEVKDAIFARQRGLEQYHKAVEAAWAEKKLNRQKIAQLYALAAGLNLSDNQVDTIERAVMGEIKEALFAHQIVLEQYHKAVEEAWSDKKLNRQKIERLTALTIELTLSKEQVAQIERRVMGDAKETVFESQKREQYLEAVQSAWSGKQLDQAKLERLSALAKELELSEEQVAQIEREVMGQVKKVLFTPRIVPLKTRLLQVLQKFQPQENIYVSPNIPSNILANLRDKCNVPHSEEILGLIDTSYYGSKKEGILFGTEDIYYRYWLQSPGKIPYSELSLFPVRKSWYDRVDVGDGKNLKTGGSGISGEKLCDILNAIKDAIPNLV